MDTLRESVSMRAKAPSMKTWMTKLMLVRSLAGREIFFFSSFLFSPLNGIYFACCLIELELPNFIELDGL